VNAFLVVSKSKSKQLYLSQRAISDVFAVFDKQELIYVWNGFHVIGKKDHLLTPMLVLVEHTVNDILNNKGTIAVLVIVFAFIILSLYSFSLLPLLFVFVIIIDIVVIFTG
jgi:hypothetical protein